MTSIYFSPKGTTQATARAITSAWEGVTERDLLTEPLREPVAIPAGEPVLVAMPVYAGRIPGLCREMLERYLQGSGGPAVAVAVYGNRDYDDALAELQDLLDGLHFHTLCEQDSDALEQTLEAVAARFGDALPRMQWLNFGGGHHITRPDYDLELLESCIRHVQRRYGVEVYLEPGEAVALNAGYLVTEVLERVENGGITTLILDASAACHMPDVLEMPYRPPLKGSGLPGEKAYTYRLGSYTCLAGDIIGDYSFDTPVEIGDKLVFEDMAIYSMVKNNTFNGIPLPSIYEMAGDGSCRLIKAFGYSDFKERLS